ncbi:peptidase M23 [Micromonospora sp. NPDC049523]|uniref:peptidase M23 n=1 Tax=Micromonospora sp. NPDC049523 TaxID=3155921 RepID=UPI0034369D47
MRDDDRLEPKEDAVGTTDRSDDAASDKAATGSSGQDTDTRGRLDRLTTALRSTTVTATQGLATAITGLRQESLNVITKASRLRASDLRALARRWGSPRQIRPVPRTVAVGLLCALGLLAFTQGRIVTGNTPAESEPSAARSALVQRAQADQAASRSEKRTEAAPTATADPDVPAAQPSPPPAAPAPAPPVDPGPVAGLTGVQMDNAKAIVRTGHDMGMPRRALVIGVATAMQESNLLNLANNALPESLNHSHQGTGWDHDSVGLFQQRTSSGWGPVDKLMDPAYATAQFFNALRRIPGWQQMALTDAAQAVQVSAFPGYYAQHEGAATEVVDAIIPPNR